jgi:hypothetical protein
LGPSKDPSNHPKVQEPKVDGPDLEGGNPDENCSHQKGEGAGVPQKQQQ